MTADLVCKRDVLRRQLGTELGDRTFREWLERSLAAVSAEDAAEAAVSPPMTVEPEDAVEAPMPEAKPVAAAPAAETRRAGKTGRWSVADIDTLHRMVEEGEAPQAIADRLGRTRHGVISVASRRGLNFQRRPDDAGDGRDGTASAGSAGEEPAQPPTPDAAGSTPAPRSEPAESENGHDTRSDEPEAEIPEPRPAPRGGCLWPEGEPPELTFCGAERSPGRSYCPEHCLRAYRTSSGAAWPIERFQSPPPERAAA